MRPLPSAVTCSRSADSNSGSPKNASAPWSEKPISSRRMTPAVAAERPPSSLSSGLPSSLRQVADHGAQVGEVEQRQAGLVGVVEDQAEAGLLGLVEAEHLGQQDRAERRHGDAQRDAGALAADRVVLDREALGLPVLADRRRAGGELVAGLAGRGEAGEVALHVGGEHGYAVGAELLGEELQGLGLAGAGRAGDQAVPVEHRERDPDVGVGQRRGVEHQAAQLERGLLERVARRDGLDDRAVGVRLGAGTTGPGCRRGSAGGRRVGRGSGRRPPRGQRARPRRYGEARVGGGGVGPRGLRHAPSLLRAARVEREAVRPPAPIVAGVIFKRVGEGRPYPDHGLTSKGWAALPPRQVRLDELVTTKDTCSSSPCWTRTRRSTATCSRTSWSGRASTTWRTVCTARCVRPSSSATCCTPGSTWPADVNLLPSAKSALTLGVLALLLVVGVSWGFAQVTKPFPGKVDPPICVDTSYPVRGADLPAGRHGERAQRQRSRGAGRPGAGGVRRRRGVRARARSATPPRARRSSASRSGPRTRTARRCCWCGPGSGRPRCWRSRSPAPPGIVVVVGADFENLFDGGRASIVTDDDIVVCGPSPLSHRPAGRRQPQPLREPAVRAHLAQPLLGRVAQLARGDDQQVVAVLEHRAAFGHQRLPVADHHRDRRRRPAAAARRPRRRASARPG